MGRMCVTYMDLTPRVIFSDSIYLYIHLNPFIHSIISVVAILVTFQME